MKSALPVVLPTFICTGTWRQWQIRLERVTRSRLPLWSARRSAGLAAPEIIARLQAVHSGPFPEALARRIRAWSGHYGSAALEQVALFQVRDAQTLSELLDDPEIGPLLKPFTPPDLRALARIRPADLEKLRALLAERGIELTNRIE